jgi:hypothetical protein
VELFDLKADPMESTNLAAGQPDKVKELLQEAGRLEDAGAR